MGNNYVVLSTCVRASLSWTIHESMDVCDVSSQQAFCCMSRLGLFCASLCQGLSVMNWEYKTILNGFNVVPFIHNFCFESEK